jgi:hypothetical protein
MVTGKIPVTQFLERLASPGAQIPAINSVEVRSDLIRIFGLEMDEYVIEVTRA